MAEPFQLADLRCVLHMMGSGILQSEMWVIGLKIFMFQLAFFPYFRSNQIVPPY